MGVLIDLIFFLLLPLACWRLVRGAVPMAVLPILTGLTVAIAADRTGFDKAVLGPSAWGEAIGWFGVMVLAFSAGLETRATVDHAPRLDRRLLLSAVAALALPFITGFLTVVSGALAPVLKRPEAVSSALSASAIGLCLAVSALPVLVGIVRELPIADRSLGNLALRIAAFDDALLWAGLALLLFVHDGETAAIMSRSWHPLAAIALLASMVAARGRIDRFLPDGMAASGAIGLGYLLAGAWSTDALGLHELLGAYFAGALAPRQLDPERLGKIALFGLSPLFFAHRGLDIDGALVTPEAIGVSIVLLAAGGLAKLVSVHLFPPVPTLPLAERTRLGLLLQCKGLMEIVAATILVQAGLITATVFAVLVTLALISTTLTVPLFRLASRLANPSAGAATG